MVRYFFKDDAVLTFPNAKNADPQIVGEEIDRVRAMGDGELFAPAVVDAARNKKNPLHSFFEWRDDVAAEAYRVEQARELIRLIRVEDKTISGGSSRAFINVRVDSGRSYRSVRDIKESVDLRAAVLAAAERELEAFMVRYSELKEVCEFVEKAQQAVRKRRGSTETRVGA
jgi:hypothetical protein